MVLCHRQLKQLITPKTAKVPIIVAINKCDKENSDPNRVRTELLKYEIVVESMSGEVLDVEVSATTGKGIDNLIENIVLQSEILELKSNPKRLAEGTVIEAKLDVGRGPVATVLVQKGTLNRSDIIVVGDQWGKVRALIDSNNSKVEFAGPSVPVEVLGLNGTPEAGDLLNVVSSETKAREIADYRKQVVKDKKDALGKGKTLDQMIAKAKADTILISGHNGGTGASPQTSIKYAGLPWELGLSEVHQVLSLNNLRDKVVLRTDGGLKTGKDIVIAAMLGAEEYGIGTASLVAMGCIMVRQCHSNTCPVGVCSQDEKLREKFSGTPEKVINLFSFIADEVREILGSLGFSSLDEVVGRSDLLYQVSRGSSDLDDLDLNPIIQTIDSSVGEFDIKKNTINKVAIALILKS